MMEVCGFLKLHMVLTTESDCMSGRPLLLGIQAYMDGKLGQDPRVHVGRGLGLIQDPFISL